MYIYIYIYIYTHTHVCTQTMYTCIQLIYTHAKSLYKVAATNKEVPGRAHTHSTQDLDSEPQAALASPHAASMVAMKESSVLSDGEEHFYQYPCSKGHHAHGYQCQDNGCAASNTKSDCCALDSAFEVRILPPYDQAETGSMTETF